MKVNKLQNRSTVWYGLACLVVVSVAMSIGCDDGKTVDNVESSTYDSGKFVLQTEPAGGQDVITARENSKDQEEIVVVGRIGGALNPWVQGRAAFQIVDSSLLACSDEKADGEPCSCKTPWDYCCETDKLPTAMALVQFVEADGATVKHDARKIFGLTELQTVVVKGKAKRDGAGNLTVLADAMYIRK